MEGSTGRESILVAEEVIVVTGVVDTVVLGVVDPSVGLADGAAVGVLDAGAALGCSVPGGGERNDRAHAGAFLSLPFAPKRSVTAESAKPPIWRATWSGNGSHNSSIG